MKSLDWIIILNISYMVASEPKWVNSNYILYGVNSLRLGGHYIIFDFYHANWFKNNLYKILKTYIEFTHKFYLMKILNSKLEMVEKIFSLMKKFSMNKISIEKCYKNFS